MLTVSYRDRVSNDRTRDGTRDTEVIADCKRERKLKYFGHLIRGNRKQRVLLEGKIGGIRSRRRQKYMV